MSKPILCFYLFASFFLTSCTKNITPANTTDPTPTISHNEFDEKFPDLSIPDLQKRNYHSTITQDKTIRETNSFISSQVSYNSDGLQLHALMNIPTGKQPPSGFPIVIVNHGYIPPEQFSTTNSYINTSAYFANAGFLVLKPDYRGHDQSEGTPSGLLSRSEYAIDVLNLIAGIKESLPQANPEQVFLYGHSMGGEVSLIVLEVNPNIKAASLWAPATKEFPENALYFSRKNRDQERTNKLNSQLSQINTKNYELFGSWGYYKYIKVPINLHHGTADESVPYEWGTALKQKLEEQEIMVNFYSYSNDTHDIPRNWGTALARDVALFQKSIE